MSRSRGAFVVAAILLLALALCRRGAAAGGTTSAVDDLSRLAGERGPCLACGHGDPDVHVADAVGGPSSAEVLAAMGYEVTAPESGPALASAPDGDDAWMRPIAVAQVRRLPVARVDPRRADVAAPTADVVAARSVPRAATSPRSPASAVALPTGPSVVGAERRVSDGVVLLMAGSTTGTPIHRGADGKVRITNLSNGDYSVMFLDPVKVDGLVIPACTEMPVVGQLEIDLQRDSNLVILPHASTWPSTAAPTGDG